MAEDMGKVIRDLASRRALIKIGEELAEQAYAAPVDATIDGMIETAETSLAALAEGGIQIRQVSLTEAVLMPLLDRCHRMMARSITHLESRRGRGATTSVTVRQAGQVNVDCAVINENQP
jgi:replicative DNA helicase